MHTIFSHLLSFLYRLFFYTFGGLSPSTCLSKVIAFNSYSVVNFSYINNVYHIHKCCYRYFSLFCNYLMNQKITLLILIYQHKQCADSNLVLLILKTSGSRRSPDRTGSLFIFVYCLHVTSTIKLYV